MLALIDINLLPGGKRGAGRPKAGRKLSIPSFAGLGENLKGDPIILGLIVLAVVVLGHLGFLFVTQTQRLGSIETDLEAQRQDSVRFAENIAAADSLRARQDTLIAKANVIRGIDGDRYVWAHILNEVSVALPEFTWLTASAAKELDLSVRQSLRPDRHAVGNADEVGILEFDSGALIAIVEKDFDPLAP